MSIGILGGGLSGLAIGYHLRDNFEIIEKEERPGGLLRSQNADGYTFDIGGSHILFSKNRSVLNEMLKFMDGAIKHRRRTFIYYQNRFIKYPFENGIYALSPEERYEILIDLIKNLNCRERKPKNLEDFFVQKFGRKMTEMYFKPYNEKLWRRKMEDISVEWALSRVPNPPLEDILRSLVGIETDGYVHQLNFYYPFRGGFEGFVNNLASTLRDKIITGEEVKEMKFEDGKVIVKGKEDHTYDSVISTIPLPSLGKTVGGKIKSLANDLHYNSVTVVGLGVRGEFPDYHWIYVPQKDIAFYRISFLHNYSQNMAPEGRASLIVEISHGPDEDIGDPVDLAIDGLEKMGFKFDVEVSGYWTNKYAYVVYDAFREKNIEKIKKELDKMGVILAGRFGLWEYMTMDDVWNNAKSVAKKVDAYESSPYNSQQK